MAGKINFLGHPVHPMLVVFPLGLLPSAVACDIIYLVRDNPNWGHISYWLVAAGVISGIVAAGFLRPGGCSSCAVISYFRPGRRCAA